MTVKHFFLALLLISLFAAGACYALFAVSPQAAVHGPLPLAAVFFFSLICTVLFFGGRAAAGSSNKHSFSTVVTGSVFGKMALAIAFLFIYRAVAQPENAWFVGIFLFIYAIYTIFEVWFMTKLAR